MQLAETRSCQIQTRLDRLLISIRTLFHKKPLDSASHTNVAEVIDLAYSFLKGNKARKCDLDF